MELYVGGRIKYSSGKGIVKVSKGGNNVGGDDFRQDHRFHQAQKSQTKKKEKRPSSLWRFSSCCATEERKGQEQTKEVMSARTVANS